MNSPTPALRPAAGAIRGTWIALPIAVVLAVYVWFISAGLWTSWPPTAIFNYTNQLASAFREGHLYLDDQPSPELLALQDPYRIAARKGIAYIWDATLFNGRYYLYWGPTPALLILPIKMAAPSLVIGDNLLVFGFVCGLYILLCILLWRVWDRFFQGLPAWILLLAILLAGLVTPLTWMLARPEVYEAAISAGQFFLLLGLYMAFNALRRHGLSFARLGLASLCWGLAIGARTSEALPAAFLVLATATWMLSNRERGGKAVPRILAPIALLGPVAVCAIGLAWYNWARFGSIMEFGYRYQLTLLQLPRHYNEIFSLSYVLPNLYNYLLNPYTLSHSFPFIKPQYGISVFATQLAVPRIYFSEAITGLVFTVPFLALAGRLLFKPVGPSKVLPATDLDGSAGPGLRTLVFWLFGVFALEAGSVLVFFFATMRYLGDVVPALLLMSVVGFWQAYAAFSARPLSRAVLVVVAVCLSVISILVSTLLAISSYQDRFLTANPALIQQINRLLFP
jgi:hypothetical protein